MPDSFFFLISGGHSVHFFQKATVCSHSPHPTSTKLYGTSDNHSRIYRQFYRLLAICQILKQIRHFEDKPTSAALPFTMNLLV